MSFPSIDGIRSSRVLSTVFSPRLKRNIRVTFEICSRGVKMLPALFALPITIASLLLSSCSHERVVEHRLTFAANPELGITETTLNDIVQEMNVIVQHPDYTWDAPCSQVRFVKSGTLVAKEDLPLAGPFDYQVKQFRKLAPSANVLLVSSVGCGNVASAAGCAHIGAEPAIMALNSPGYEALTVLHERGHNMGFPHSAESPTVDRQVAEQIGMRYMFWRLGQGHIGQTPRECEGFTRLTYPSIASARDTDSSSRLLAAEAAPPVTDRGESSIVRREELQNEAARAAGLTPRAYGVVAPPLLEGKLPFTEISELDKDDLESLRKLLRGTPNSYWLNACYVLAIVGGPEDVALIENALTRPLTASATTSLQARNPGQISKAGLIALKIGAADSLGMIANRISRLDPHAAQSAVDTLFKVAHIDQAGLILGQSQAAMNLSRSAQRALSLPQTETSRQFVARILKSTETASLRGREFAPLELEDITIMNLNRLELQKRDIISFLKQKP